MGFLDALFGKPKCPACGTKGAKQSGTQVRCPNPSCRLFDGSLRRRAGGTSRSDFSPDKPLTITYRNFRGQEKWFTADEESLERKRNHIVARVVPTGERISLSRDRIQNLDEVDRALAAPAPPADSAPKPSARERQVLGFHRKHNSTSPLYEEIRAKYPDYQ